MSKEINHIGQGDSLNAMPSPPKYQSTENFSESQIKNPPSYNEDLAEKSSLINDGKADSDLVEIKIEADDANQAPESSGKGCCSSCCQSWRGGAKQQNNNVASARRDNGGDTTIICCISCDDDASNCGNLCTPIFNCFASIFDGIADCCSGLAGIATNCISAISGCVVDVFEAFGDCAGASFELCGQCLESSGNYLDSLADAVGDMDDFGD